MPADLAPELEGPEEEAPLTGPERRCIVTGQVLPKTRLIRFAVSPDGEVVPDVAGRLPGRGIWLSAARDVVNTAVAKRLFSRAAKKAVTASPDLAERVEVLLTERALATLGLARRSGRAVAGYEKVRAEIMAGRAAVVIDACDGGADGVGRVRALALGLARSGAKRPAFVTVFVAAQLGVVFGRDAVVHAVITPGSLAEAFVQHAGLLAEYRGLRPDQNEAEDGAPPSV